MNPEWEERELEELLAAKMLARERFVKAWREQHPRQVWGKSWACPLCSRVVQTTDPTPIAVVITYHEMEHGQDWRDYWDADDEASADAAR